MNRELVVLEKYAGERLDRFLAAELPEYSRSQLQHLVISGKVSGARPFTKSRIQLVQGETIFIALPDPNQQLKPVEGLLEILYEDDQILAINKMAGIQVHPNSLEDGTSVIQVLISMRPEITAAVLDPESEISRLRPGIVHRLDKDTTGVLLVAKTRPSLINLIEQFRTHQVHKTYETLLSGTLSESRTVNAPLQRKPGRENMMGVAKDPEQGREAISHFTPLRYFYLPNGLVVTHVSCVIETGRTHQIRAHAKSMGMPVIGDMRYANRPSEAISKKLGVTRQLLHAKQLSLFHTDKQLVISSPLPADFLEALAQLEAFDNHSSHVLT